MSDNDNSVDQADTNVVNTAADAAATQTPAPAADSAPAPVVAPVINSQDSDPVQQSPAPVVPVPVADSQKDDEKAAQKAAKKEAAAAKKEAKAKEKREKKEAKKAEKKAKLQAKIDACPRDYKPLSTSKSFWTMLVCGIPALGILVSIIMSLVPVNKNIKFIAKGLLVLHIIAIILILIALLVAVYVFGAELDSIIEAFQKFFEAIASAINV